MASETRSGILTKEHITHLAAAIDSAKLEGIASGYLDFDFDKVNDIRKQCGTDPQKFNREILRIWKNQNKEKDQVKALRTKLNNAAEQYGDVDMPKINDILERYAVTTSSGITEDLNGRSSQYLNEDVRPETGEKEFEEIAEKIRLAAKFEKKTPFCDLISDKMDEIELSLRVEHKQEVLKNYKLLFDEPQGTSRVKRVLLKDDSGIGKTSIVRRIEYDWGKRSFDRFPLVLLVSLRYMKTGDRLEEVILRQNMQLHEMLLNSKKLRYILESYGEKCLLLLDGWGEHSGSSEDVLQIIKGERLSECSVILTSRSEFIDKKTDQESHQEIDEKCFQTVVKSEGFPKDYAKSFAKNILSTQDKVRTVQRIGIHDQTLRESEKDPDEPLYKNPALFLFVCVLYKLKEIQFPVKIGEIYFRTVRFLYKKYSFESKVSDDYVPWLKAVGRDAFKMLKEGPFLVNRESIVESLGREIYHWAILTDYMYIHPTRTLPDDVYLTFPSFAIQEFFAAFYYKKFVKKERKEKTETYEVVGEILSNPQECFRKYRVLSKSDMFQAFFNWTQ